MNISRFLPKIAISESVFGTVYDIVVSGECPALVRISDGAAWEREGAEYRQISDPVGWLLDRSQSIPGAARSVANSVPGFKALVSDYIRRFCEGGGKAMIEFHGPELGGVTLTCRVGDETQVFENQQIRVAFSKYMAENQQKVSELK